MKYSNILNHLGSRFKTKARRQFMLSMAVNILLTSIVVTALAEVQASTDKLVDELFDRLWASPFHHTATVDSTTLGKPSVAAPPKRLPPPVQPSNRLHVAPIWIGG